MEENEIKIGDQTWTSKNLDLDTYRNGDEIPQVKDKEEWANLTTGAWCYYENKTANGTNYGKLYNWYAVNDPRGLAPKGYHIPTDNEWTILTDKLGDKERTKMKSTFAMLPGGYRTKNGNFSSVGAYSYWWSSSEYYNYGARYSYLYYNTGFVLRNYGYKQNGFSVRCLRD